MGYCMGGTLTVALAARQPRRVAGLALLAAPWDFHADRTGHAFLLSAGPLLAQVADQVGELPVDVLQTLFWSLDPWLSVKKFGRFLGMDPAGRAGARIRAARGLAERRRAARRSDGARMPGRLVRRQPAGHAASGSSAAGASCRRRSTCRALVMIPSGDRIVPPLSAAALAEPKRGLKNATRLDLPLGHIGMVVSGRARELCWTPLIDWLAASARADRACRQTERGASTGACRRSGRRCWRSRSWRTLRRGRRRGARGHGR